MIHISNRNEGGMTEEQKIAYITETLDSLSTDIIDLIFKIVLYAESGLE